jgi:hypothetical protein
MKALAVAMLLAAACPAPAASAADGGGLLTEAARQLGALEALADLAASSSSVGSAGRVASDESAAYCAASPATIAFLPIRDRELLYGCFAFVERNPARCLAIPAAFITRTSENCSTVLENMALFVDLVAPGPASLRTCEAGFGIANPPLSPEERVKACAALSRPGDEEARCAAFREQVPRPFVGVEFKDCVNTLRYIMTGRGCDGFHKGSIQRLFCPSFAKFTRARAGGDAGPCGADYLCRALGGEAKACEEERTARVSSVCEGARRGAAQWPAAPTSPALRREISAAVSWAVYLPLLDQAGRDALFRLHRMMLGEIRLNPDEALADLTRLRAGSVDELLYRAEQLSAAAPDGPEMRRVRELRGRADKARGRIARSRKAAAKP